MKLASYIFLFLIIFIGNVCIKESQASDPENVSGSIFTRSYKEDEKTRNSKKKTTTNRENEIQQIKKQIERLVDNDLKYIVENIFEFFGSFNSVFIFDCEQPSYIDSSNQLVRLKSSLKEELKKIGKCERKDFVWHDALDQDKMLGFSYSRNNFTKSLYEIREILKLFNRHNACDDLLKFLKHPSMSLRNYEKPLECKSNKKSFGSNIKSSDAGKSNNYKKEKKIIFMNLIWSFKIMKAFSLMIYQQKVLKVVHILLQPHIKRQEQLPNRNLPLKSILIPCTLLLLELNVDPV